MKDFAQFLVEFARNPKTIGAVASSSSALAREIVSDLGIRDAKLVVEYGPGTGAFTGRIEGMLSSDADFLAIERNERMLQSLRRRHPDTPVVHDSIANAPDILASHGHEPGTVDAIVSGLPWAAFDDALQDRLLDATAEILADGGSFATFAYIHGLLLPAGRRFRRKLESRFRTVTRSPIVWKNLPPAFVYRCRVPS